MIKPDFMWSVLVHLGSNMWNEEGNTRACGGGVQDPEAIASSTLRFDRQLWDKYINKIHAAGANTIIIDIGEALVYDTHPELAVKGSWTKEEMKAELKKLRAMGFEVVPKLNFSAGHDIWLGEYSYMVSSSIYRQVCADLISEVCEVFKPKYFHLGMDEETWNDQSHFDYAVIRQRDVYWRDFYHLVDCVEKENVRPWIWSDRMWHHTEEFLKKMPKSVLQSNWYYSIDFDKPKDKWREHRIKCFELLDKHGFDQVPTGSNFGYYENMEILAKYCYEKIDHDRLYGFMQTPWLPFINNQRCRNMLFGSAAALDDTIKAFREQGGNK